MENTSSQANSEIDATVNVDHNEGSPSISLSSRLQSAIGDDSEQNMANSEIDATDKVDQKEETPTISPSIRLQTIALGMFHQLFYFVIPCVFVINMDGT